MNIAQLKKELAALGFSKLGALEENLPSALSRTLKIIHAEHPEYRTRELAFFPEPERKIKEKIRSKSEDITLNFEVGTLSFKLQGEGKYRMRDGEITREVEFSALCREEKIHFCKGGTLTLLGGGSYVAFDLSHKRELPPPLADATSTRGDYYAIDLAKLYPDFLCLSRAPMDKNRFDIPALRTVGGTSILVPKCFSGVLNLTYKRRAMMPDETLGEEAQIDIGDELEPLLVLLCGYYIWLDDEPEKAAAYKEQYEALSAKIKRRGGNESCTFYIDTNHWS